MRDKERTKPRLGRMTQTKDNREKQTLRQLTTTTAI